MSTTYQVQLKQVLEDGTEINVNPKNDIRDVAVGALTNGSLHLPGSDPNEMLHIALGNIRKYLANLSNIASESRVISQDPEHTSAINIPSSAVTSNLKGRLDGHDNELANHMSEINKRALIMHSDDTVKYGGGTKGKYGHVRVSDTYAVNETGGNADGSMAASQNALYNAYNTLNGAKAPNNHASTAATYGLGTSSQYGHVKTSSTYTSTETDESVAATRKALYNVWHALDERVTTNATNIGKKANTAHTSSDATAIGKGTSSLFGHLKITDEYGSTNATSAKAEHGVAASGWSVYRAYEALKALIDQKAASSHTTEVSTSVSKLGHVYLSDSYTTDTSKASTGRAASIGCTKALYDLITSLQSTVSTLNTTLTSLKNTVNAHTLYKSWNAQQIFTDATFGAAQVSVEIKTYGQVVFIHMYAVIGANDIITAGDGINGRQVAIIPSSVSHPGWYPTPDDHATVWAYTDPDDGKRKVRHCHATLQDCTIRIAIGRKNRQLRFTWVYIRNNTNSY